MDLHGQVLPGAERPANAGQGDAHLVLRQAEAGGHLAAVRVQPLGRHEQVDTAVLGRYRKPGLRAEKRLVLHADLVLAADDHVGPRPGVVQVSPADLDPADEVAARMQRRRVRGEGHARVGHGRQHLIVGLDPGDRAAGRFRVIGRHQRYRLALVPDLVRSPAPADRCSSP